MRQGVLQAELYAVSPAPDQRQTKQSKALAYRWPVVRKSQQDV